MTEEACVKMGEDPHIKNGRGAGREKKEKSEGAGKLKKKKK